ncbi:motility-associated ABC transporter substrate-binding family protein [Sphingomonas prati]|uniref:Uncharacterized protein n=1 Tax=Sphingomonas prati TaxID=1843237 RepID=A0A7W9BTM6_9SPHN|nr:hypothetical protein [Sphingomonas prati]MBB5729912.1 hypothetical protein [Sphingomonas prati]
MRAAGVSAVVTAVVDLVAQAGMTIQGRPVAAVGLAILLVIPGAGGWYAQLAAGDGETRTRRRVAVLAGVPLQWGEGGVDLSSGPGDAWRMLGGVFQLDAVDDAAQLTGGDLLLVQPRAPAPEGLVAIDARIRAGARAVILTDPDLHWTSRHALGDPAAPPRAGTLGPLLLHWGLRLELGDRGIAVREVTRSGRRWRLVLDGAGRFVAAGTGPCRVSAGGLVVDCRLGRGRAVLVADADMLDAALWTDGAGGWRPAWRRSDNAAFVAALIAGRGRIMPPARPVQWREAVAAGAMR